MSACAENLGRQQFANTIEIVAGLVNQTTADDHQIGIKDVDERADADSNPLGELLEHSERGSVTFVGGSGDVLPTDRRWITAGELHHANGSAPLPCSTHRLLGQPGESRPRGVALPAATPTARAKDSIAADDHMAGFAGESVGSDPQVTVDHHGPADPSSESNHHDVRSPLTGTQFRLRPERTVGIVLDQHRRTHGLLNTIPQRLINGTQEVGCAPKYTPAIDHTRHPDSDRGNGMTAVTSIGPQELDDVTEGVDDIVDSVGRR